MFHNKKTDVVQLRNGTLHTTMHDPLIKTAHAINNKLKNGLSVACISGNTKHKHKACIHTIFKNEYKHEITECSYSRSD